MNKKVAIYCRLSKEDGQNESLSIVNQKKVLVKFVEETLKENYSLYVDDGYSGTNFDRPSFKRMIEDITNQKLSTVVCKDLSRLGRNYIHVGYYLEDFFPSNDIRFIALNDNFDSSNENEFAPFKNIINEWYAKDISKKVRFTLDNNAKLGVDRKTAFPLYGYKYNNLSERVIDEATSKVVKSIFNEYIKSRSIAKVIKYLFDNKIYTPGYYNYLTYNYNCSKYQNYQEDKKYLWIKETITSIIKNEEYLGHYITKKTKTKSYKLKKRIKTNQNQKHTFKNRYPKIIDEEVFTQANVILSSKGKRQNNSQKPYHRLLKCASCNKPLAYQKNKDRYYCVNKKCTCRVYVQCKEIEKVMENEIKLLKNKINLLSVNDLKKINFKKEIESLEKRNEELRSYIRRAIESKLSDEMFNEIMNNYQNEIKVNERKIKEYEIDYLSLLNNLKGVNLNNYIDRIFLSIAITKNSIETKKKKFIITYNKFI